MNRRDRLPTMDEFSEQCRQVIAKGEFQKAELTDVDDWSHLIVKGFLTTDSIGWTVAKMPVRCVVKVDDAFLKYLITMPVGCYEGQPGEQFY